MKITDLLEDIVPEKEQTVRDFIKWASEKLDLKGPLPDIEFSQDTDLAQDGHHTGSYNHDQRKLWVYAKKRNLVDIFRTVAHELVHVKQHELGTVNSSGPGSPVEVEADKIAGYLMKIWLIDNRDTIQ